VRVSDLDSALARQALAADPDDAVAHALLALALAHLDQGREAVSAGQRAVALAPESSFTHYALGCAHLERGELATAELAAREALRLEPDGHGFALLAQIHVRQKRWNDALAAAEGGLQIEPEHQGCGNLRALALGALGRPDAAALVMDEVLAADPDDASSHANRGWLMLRQARVDEALLSFRAALRLDPTSDWARHGIIEAMKARSAPYRLVLRYQLWVDTLGSRAQWLLILGLYFGGRIVSGILRAYPGLWPVLGPVMVVYVAVVFGTWIADPLSNLVLRLDPFGRLALNRVETIASTIVGGCVAVGTIAVAVFAITDNESWLNVAMICGFLLIPIGGAVKGYGSRAYRPLLIASALIGACGVGAAVLSFTPMPLAIVLFGVFLAGTILYAWVANFVLLKDE
jgi:tetratricopeptide (TPR) repeat protein